MYKVVVSPSNRFAYKMGPNKESQNTANTIVLDDEDDDDEPEEKNETVDQPEIKRTIGNLKISTKFHILLSKSISYYIDEDKVIITCISYIINDDSRLCQKAREIFKYSRSRW